jgi:outer membrane protein assembly factor BamB
VLLRTRLLVSLLLITTLPGCAGRKRPADPATVFPIGTVWTASVDGLIEGPLAADERRLYVSTRNGSVIALDRKTGAVAWKVEGRRGLLAATPGLLVLRQADGTVWGLQPRNGEVRWTLDTGVPGSLPAIIDGDRVFVAGEGMTAADAATGKVVWTAPEKPTVSAPPVAAGPFVLAGEADGALRCRDRATGVSLWTLATGSPLLAPALVDAERHVYVGTTARQALSLRLEDGDVRWRWRVGADVRTSATLLRDKVLVASYEAVLYALKRSNGNMAWRAPLPSRPLSGPFLQGPAILIACQESDIVGLDPATGRRVGVFKTTAEMQTAPLPAGGRLYVGLRDRTVVCLQFGGIPEEPPAPAAPEG